MSTDHQAFLLDTFEIRVPLFNDVCHGRSEPLLDVWEAIPDWETDTDAVRNYVYQVMDYIWTSIPGLLQNLGTYLQVEGKDGGLQAILEAPHLGRVVPQCAAAGPELEQGAEHA
jgi:hypothetical protein